MRITASSFNLPDPTNLGYSLMEVDFYGAIAGKGHRLSIRKNLKTDRYEVFKHHYTERVVREYKQGGYVEMRQKTDRDEVIYTYATLTDAVRTADRFTKDLTGYDPQDEVDEYE